MAQSPRPESCSTVATAHGESMAGTAPQARGFLLVEHDGPWSPEPLDTLAEVGAVVEEAADLAGLRPGLIRRVNRAGVTTVGHTVLISVPDEGGVLISRRFDSLRELDPYDLEDVTEQARDGETPDGWRRVDPVLVVCTQPRSETCDTASAEELAAALHEKDPSAVWETSRLDGHRFAPTAVALPAGLVYGRLQAAQAGELIASLASEQILLENLRGRATLAPSAQVAEIEVRARAGARRDGAVVLLDEVESKLPYGVRSVTEWEADGVAWAAVVDRLPGEQAGLTPRRMSCEDGEVSAPDAFRVVGVHAGGVDRTAGQWDGRHRGTHPDPANPTVVGEISRLAPGTALDIACGTGRHSLLLAKEGWNVTAIDFSAEAIAVLRQEAAARDLRVNAVVADASAWEPAAGQRFDLILMTFVSLPDVFAKALRWLTPGGRIVLVGHSVRNLTEGAGGPSDPRLLHDPVDLAARATGARLRVLRAGEVERATSEGTALDAVLVARQPAAVLDPANAQTTQPVRD